MLNWRSGSVGVAVVPGCVGNGVALGTGVGEAGIAAGRIAPQSPSVVL